MRILHILDHSIPLQSGYSFRTSAILEHQRSLGWETFHITTPKHNESTGETPAEEDVNGLHFYRTPIRRHVFGELPIFNQWSLIQETLRRLDTIIPKINPDILHAHSPALNGEVAIGVRNRYGIPIIYEIRAFWEDAAVDHGRSREWGIRYRLTRALETHVLKRADAVTTICDGLRNEIVGRGISRTKITVIPNAVDNDRFNVNSPRNERLAGELGLQKGEVLGFIGSFYAYEGLPLLIDAMPNIISQKPNVRLLLVGGGPDESRIRQRIMALSLQHHVVHVGRIPHEQIQQYYNLVDVFVYPRYSSRLTDLVTPLKPLEAMAQGKIVVASDVGGHRELIRPGVTGELFRAGDVTALAQTVLGVINCRENRNRVQKTARQFVETERNWIESVSRYKQVYQSVLHELA